MGQAGEACPIVLVEGLASTVAEGRGRDLLRPKEKDLFR
jgi:F420-0:gamma-glutamyl ligase